MKTIWLGLAAAMMSSGLVGLAQVTDDSPAARMAATVMREWPEGRVTTQNNPGIWGYEEGVLLDGIAAVWHARADA